MANGTPSNNKDNKSAARPPVPPAPRHTSPLSIEGIRGGTLHSMMIKVIMGLLILIFAVGFMFTSFNPTSGIRGANGEDPQRVDPGASPDPVARLGDDAIGRQRFLQIAARQDQFMEQFGQKVGPLEYLASRQRTLQSLLDNLAVVQAAKAAGLQVSDEEVKAEINQRIDKQIASEQKNGAASFRRQVEAQYGSMESYRSELQKLAESERESLESSLLLDKLEKKIKDDNKVTEANYKAGQTKLKLRQIVLRPQLAGAADKATQEKNKLAAQKRAQKIFEQLKAKPTPQNFDAVAKKESDDLATKTKGGDLAWKLPAELPLPIEVRDAVLQAKGNLIGPLADAASGDQYIFLVEGRALRLPADWAKNKAKLLKEFETQRDNEVWQAYQNKVSKAASPEILDPALQAYKIQTEQAYSAAGEEAKTLRQQALQKYQEALSYAMPTEAASIHYQLSQLYRDMNQPKETTAALRKAVEEATHTPQLRLELARSLRDGGDKKGALAELQKVSKEVASAPAAPPSMFGGNPNDALHYQMAAEFEALGRQDLAAKERVRVLPAGGMGRPGGAVTIPPR